MRTPARLLADYLIPNMVLPLRSPEGEEIGEINHAQILVHIRRGDIYGVGSKSRLRFVVIEEEKPKQVLKDQATEEKSGSIISSDASVTVFREPVRDENGNVFARVWTHKRRRYCLV